MKYLLLLISILVIGCNKKEKIDIQADIVCNKVLHTNENTLTYKGDLVLTIKNNNNHRILIQDIDPNYVLKSLKFESNGVFDKANVKNVEILSGQEAKLIFPIGGKLTSPIKHTIKIKILIDGNWSNFEAELKSIK